MTVDANEPATGSLLHAERVGAMRLLACLLAVPPDAGELRALAGMHSEGPFAASVARLAQTAAEARADAVADEFQRLFIGLGGGELMPYASRYLAGSLHDAPLVRLRQDMRRLGLARPDGIGEPEDHAATILEIAAGLLDGSISCPAAAASEFVRTHILSWLPDFFDDLSRVRQSPFYAAVGALGFAVMSAEGTAALPAVLHKPESRSGARM